MAPERFIGTRRSLRSVGLLLLTAGLSWGCTTGAYRAPEAPTPEQIPSLEREAAAGPTDVDVLVRLGAAYRAAGRLDDARRVLQQALRVDKSSAEATSVLGMVYDESGADSSAVDLYQKYLAEHPDGPLAKDLRERLALVRRRALQASVKESLAREAQLASTPPQPRTVGVFPFAYQGPDQRLEPLGRALAEMITTDLSQTNRLKVVERLRVQLLLNEMALSAQQRVQPATAARSGHLLGAARIVQGVLDGDENDLLMQAVVVPVTGDSASMGEPLSAHDPARRFFDMEKRIVLGLYQDMGIELTPAEREAVLHRPTDNLNALLAFGLGLEAQDAGQFQQAAAHFTQAATLDPGFTSAAAAAQAAQGLNVAQNLDIGSMVQTGLADVGAANTAYDQWVARVTSFTDLEGLLPGILSRDPVPELLGKEGLSGTGASVEIIITRPGGGQ